MEIAQRSDEGILRRSLDVGLVGGIHREVTGFKYTGSGSSFRRFPSHRGFFLVVFRVPGRLIRVVLVPGEYGILDLIRTILRDEELIVGVRCERPELPFDDEAVTVDSRSQEFVFTPPEDRPAFIHDGEDEWPVFVPEEVHRVVLPVVPRECVCLGFLYPSDSVLDTVGRDVVEDRLGICPEFRPPLESVLVLEVDRTVMGSDDVVDDERMGVLPAGVTDRLAPVVADVSLIHPLEELVEGLQIEEVRKRPDFLTQPELSPGPIFVPADRGQTGRVHTSDGGVYQKVLDGLLFLECDVTKDST